MAQLKDITSIQCDNDDDKKDMENDSAGAGTGASGAIVVFEECLMTLQYTVVILYSKLTNHLIHAPFRAVGLALEAMYENPKMNHEKWQVIADFKAALDQYRLIQKGGEGGGELEEEIARLAQQVKLIGLNPVSALQSK
jgi:hypothetical protein